MDIRRLNHSQLEELIERAQKRKHELSTERVDRVRDKILGILESEGLSFDDVFGDGRRSRTPSKSKGVVVKPKYRNPENAAQTWAGRGKRPRWFVEAIDGGKNEKDLLIV